MVVNVAVKIPDWVIKPFVLIVLLYRHLRYGYAFRCIPLTQGKFAIVDPDDYHRLSLYKWHAVNSSRTYYAQRTQRVSGKVVVIIMHREIIKVDDDMLVDHINRNGLDNRKANLRPATPMQNSWNRQSRRGANRFKGVAWHTKRKKWRAFANCAGKRLYLGYFNDEIEAAKAHDEAAKKYHGQFAVLNFPDV